MMPYISAASTDRLSLRRYTATTSCSFVHSFIVTLQRQHSRKNYYNYY